MKKRWILFLLILFLIPFNVKAYGIEKFFMDVTVLDNGDIQVKELFQLNGEYNGYERILKYKDNSIEFDGSLESFEQSEIYNGSDIKITSVKGIQSSNDFDFDNMLVDKEFELVSSANNGSYGVYESKNDSNGITIKSYNPHSLNKLFYFEYIISNVVVVHNDVAELYFNVFSDEMRESIKDLIININIPNNKNELLVWAHGPYNGEIDALNKNLVQMKVPSLKEGTPVDYRIVFDKEVIINPKKPTDIDASEFILKVEQERADEANKQRKSENIVSFIFSAINIGYLLFFLKMMANFYNKHSKKYETTFKTKYFRDFPREYGPEIVSYLNNKELDSKDLSASLLNIISKKNISYEGEKEYTLKLDNEENLTLSEQNLVNWFFKEIGKENKVTLKQINKASKKYSSFMTNYEAWKKLVKEEASKQNFYEKNKKEFKYFAMALLLFIFNFVSVSSFLIPINIFIAIASIIYMFSAERRTKQGQEEYALWKGLKNFLNDFGNFKERELPHIELWEKYLVYAMSFGIATKLAKNMKIKFKELEKQGQLNTMDLYYINRMNILSNGIGRSINSSVKSAKAAHTRASSGSGSGGGFSGGGGFGGGGGGGGRF